MSPEFLNRIDDIVCFRALDLEAIRSICVLQLERLKKKLLASDMTLSITDDAIDLLAEKSFDPRYGARPIKRAINDLIVNELTIGVLNGQLDKQHPVEISSLNGSLCFRNI
jgi:ATP-dependent Clp protease ATP-binding subunit ClpB